MSPWMNKALDLLIELLWVGFAVATAYYSYRVSLVTGNSVSPGLEIPMSYPYYGMILGSVTSCSSSSGGSPASFRRPILTSFRPR